MGILAGKIFAGLFRTLEVLGTLGFAGIMTYFTIKLSHGNHSPNAQAIFMEAAGGAGFLWALFMLFLTICLLQKTFFRMFTLLGDLIFMGAFITCAVFLRSAPGEKCGGRTTPAKPSWIGNNVSGVKYSTTCRLVVTLFGIAVGLAALFAITAIISLLAKPKPKETFTVKENRNSRGAFMSSRGPTRESTDTEIKDEEKASEADMTGYRGAAPTIPVIAHQPAPTPPVARSPLPSRQPTDTNALAPVAAAPVRTTSPLSGQSFISNDGRETMAAAAFNPNNANARAELGALNQNTSSYRAYSSGTPATAYARTPNYPLVPEQTQYFDDGSSPMQQGYTSSSSYGNVDPNVGGITQKVMALRNSGMSQQETGTTGHVDPNVGGFTERIMHSNTLDRERVN